MSTSSSSALRAGHTAGALAIVAALAHLSCAAPATFEQLHEGTRVLRSPGGTLLVEIVDPTTPPKKYNDQRFSKAENSKVSVFW